MLADRPERQRNAEKTSPASLVYSVIASRRRKAHGLSCLATSAGTVPAPSHAAKPHPDVRSTECLRTDSPEEGTREDAHPPKAGSSRIRPPQAKIAASPQPRLKAFKKDCLLTFATPAPAFSRRLPFAASGATAARLLALPPLPPTDSEHHDESVKAQPSPAKARSHTSARSSARTLDTHASSSTAQHPAFRTRSGPPRRRIPPSLPRALQ